jgi:putative nucleotidyltransferase with HDIG domain
MFVYSFEGSWFSHPFWRGRFLIATNEQLESILTSRIEFLWIDEALGLAVERLPDNVDVPAKPLSPLPTPRYPSMLGAHWPARRDDPARKAMAATFGRVTKDVRGLMTTIARTRTIRSIEWTPLVSEIGVAIEYSPHALVGLTRLRTKDEYTFAHSVAVSALMMNFARHLQMKETLVHELGLAGLLHDIGKMAIPDGMLKKPDRLTDEEFAYVRTHPQQGYEILCASSDVPDVVLDVTRHHHERMDGLGYPARLSGDQLSLPVRIAAICDVFDAITADRPYKRAWSAGEAIGRMRSWEGHFDQQLLFRFMRSVGVFPAGMLVRLRTNRLAIVLDPGRRCSRVKVRAFASAIDGQPMPPVDVAIGETLAEDQIVAEENPAAWGFHDWELISEQLATMTGSWSRGSPPPIAPARPPRQAPNPQA